MSDAITQAIAQRNAQPELTRAEYAAHYNRGWKSGRGSAVLDEYAYASRHRLPIFSREVDAWVDGYLDGAHGNRGKWHLRDCSAHHNNTGGCGQA